MQKPKTSLALVLLSALASAACVSEPGVDAPPPLPPRNPTYVATQLPALGPLTGSAAAVSDGVVFLSRSRGLWSLGEGELQPRRMLSFPEPRGPVSLVTHQGALIASVQSECPTLPGYCRAHRIVTSSDGGATWKDLPVLEEAATSSPPRLFSDGAFLLAEQPDGALALFDPAAQAWRAISPEPPDGFGHLLTSVISVEEGTVFANDVYGGGVLFTALMSPTAWQKVEGLAEWGYRGFVTRPDLAVTTNDTGIFARVGGQWQQTHALESRAQGVVDTGEAFHVFSAARHLSSTDGVHWTVEADLPEEATLANAPLAHEGHRIAWVSTAGLRVSGDAGATWDTITATVDDYNRVESAAGTPFFGVGQYHWSWRSWDGAGWADLTSFGRANTFTDEGVWSCEPSTCSLFVPGRTEPHRELRLSRTLTPAFTRATSSGLWVEDQPLWSEACRATVSDGLVRVSADTGEVGLPSDDLPHEAVGNGCRIYWYTTLLVEAEGVLFASLRENYSQESPHRTFRSDDEGSSWVLVAEDRLIDLASNATGIHALFAGRGLTLSENRGWKFSEVPVPGDGDFTAVEATGDQLFVSRASWRGDSVWSRRAAGDWELLGPSGEAESFGPVQDLELGEGVLWIASATDGAWELRFGD